MNTNKLYSLFLGICFLLVSCSSDDDGGSSGGITNKDLAGKWYATEVGWVVDAYDSKAKEKIEEKSWETAYQYPDGGYLEFKPGRNLYSDSPKFVEGIMNRSCSYIDTQANERADYYCKGDTIFFFTYDSSLRPDEWESGKWKRYHIKKGSKIYYTRDNTANFNYLFPDLGIRSAVYQVEYTKKK